MIYIKIFFSETYFGKASKQYVRFVAGKATRIPEVKGECKIAAATFSLDAISTVGTVPILCPYKITLSALTSYLNNKRKKVNKIGEGSMR